MSTATVSHGEGATTATAAAQQRFKEHLDALVSNISGSVVVSDESVRHMLLGLVAQGHILLEDSPGVGKTLMAKALAYSIQGIFSRIQCTPDLLPSDITGTSIFNMKENQFEFKPGPVFCNVLVADEINRTGPRTQSALLEAMAEFQISADGSPYLLPRPFMVIATQNTTESHGVFPLPDSQLDRFLIRMRMGLPSALEEVEILSRAERGLAKISPVVSTEDIISMQEVVRSVSVSLPMKEYLVNLARATRAHSLITRGTSPRGTVLLQHAVQGWAAFEGRSYAIPEDVKQIALLVVPHRIALRPGADATPEQVVKEILETVPVPL